MTLPLFPAERIERAILLIRGQKVMLDAIRELRKPPKRKPKEIGYHTLVEKK